MGCAQLGTSLSCDSSTHTPLAFQTPEASVCSEVSCLGAENLSTPSGGAEGQPMESSWNSALPCENCS